MRGNGSQTLSQSTLIYLFYVCTYFAFMYMCVTCMVPDTHRDQKKKSIRSPGNSLREIAVAHHMGTGNQTWVLCKSSKSD